MYSINMKKSSFNPMVSNTRTICTWNNFFKYKFRNSFEKSDNTVYIQYTYMADFVHNTRFIQRRNILNIEIQFQSFHSQFLICGLRPTRYSHNKNQGGTVESEHSDFQNTLTCLVTR
jgi:hypothetical protein